MAKHKWLNQMLALSMLSVLASPVTSGLAAEAQQVQAPGPGRAPASMGAVQEAEKPLEVTGQSRNLSMSLTLRNEKDKIKFIEIRRTFRDEVRGTGY